MRRISSRLSDGPTAVHSSICSGSSSDSYFIIMIKSYSIKFIFICYHFEYYIIFIKSFRWQLLGFGMSVLENIDPNPENFVCAGIVHTKMMKIGCLLRLEPNKQANVSVVILRAFSGYPFFSIYTESILEFLGGEGVRVFQHPNLSGSSRGSTGVQNPSWAKPQNFFGARGQSTLVLLHNILASL